MSKSTGRENKTQVQWSSPSNIALVKYWGKHGQQLPRNASVSFTLSHAKTTTRITMEDMEGVAYPAVDFTFEGRQQPLFAQRTVKFINGLTDVYFPFLKGKKLTIDTQNTFPHSSGIASSASGMSALSLCLCDLEMQCNGTTIYDAAFYRKASLIARLGSGSAARSVFPGMSVWGYHKDISGSSDDCGISVADDVAPVFKNFHDDILIISDKTKSVSSTAGHQLMDNNPFAQVRYEQAEKNLTQLMIALKTGDLEILGKITEDEALTLHALMMCSNPSYILMEPASLEVINKIRKFRQKTGIPVYFTLDAGPNVHVLYPHEYVAEVKKFIREDLSQHCVNNHIVEDQVGDGPQKLV